jgi:oligosaccharide amylase
MPRDLPLGNGRVLINFDKNYFLRDFFYPHVGKENHTEGHPWRFGIWTENKMAWLDQDWKRNIRYLKDTLVTDVNLVNERLELELNCNDCVDFHETLYLKKIKIKNLADRPREVRVFFHIDTHIMESDVGDTAFFDPKLNAMIHYKEQRYFLSSAMLDDKFGFDNYTCGIIHVNGAEGTWRDAEDDGWLQGNPIAQGSVDSTTAVHVPLGAKAERTVYYWVAVGQNYTEVSTIHSVVKEKTPEKLISRTSYYWNLWVNKDEWEYHGLPQKVQELFRRSLLVLRTQIDNNGAIIAANDYDITQIARDTYSYVWPRDGALVAYSLDLAGYFEISKRFYFFCAEVINSNGYFLHKYNPDGSLASSWHPWIMDGKPQLPIQEDETALVVWALWRHFNKYRNVEFIKPLYKALIIHAGNFMVKYRDEKTGLPLPSYDLWEERHGVLAFTCGAVYGGLKSASHFARAFGDNDLARLYNKTAQEIKVAMAKYLYRPELKRFARMINFKNGNVEVDQTIDASMYGVWRFGAFPANDEKVVQTMNAIKDRLWIKTNVGGVARYENDYYHQVSQDVANVAGNPWFICTMWLAEWYIAMAKTAEEMKPAVDILNWVADHALESGVLAEQVNPYTNEPLSVSPLTWSHATVVITVMNYLNKLQDLNKCQHCGNPVFELKKNRYIVKND